MKIIKLDSESKKDILENLLKRSPNQYEKYAKTVNEIIEEVKSKKDQALFYYTKQFDKADLNSGNIRVTEEEIKEAYSFIDPSVLEVIRKAALNIEVYHAKQKQYSWFDSEPNGIIL